MGTRFEIVLAEDSAWARAIGEEALREIEHWHGRLSRFSPDSDVSRLNRDAEALIDNDLRELMALCDGVRGASEGAFDPRVGAGGALDLGAVGKGFALDRAAAILLDHGVQTVLLHGGTSSVMALGAPPGAEGWHIDIRSDGEPLRIALRDQALGVSAPRGRVSASGDTHVIDPRTGNPANHTDTAAVIAPLARFSCAGADAWSTALVVLGSTPPAFPAEFEAHVHRPGRGWLSRHPFALEPA